MAQRFIKDSFWTDGRVEDLDPIEKLLYLYLITNPLCNIAWIYEIKTKRMAYETGIDRDMVNKIINRFVEYDKILRFEDRIIIKNFAKNQATNPNVKIWMQRILNDVPDRVRAGFDSLCIGSIEALGYFTLLNLTLPNFTLLNSTEKSESLENQEIEETEEKEKPKKSIVNRHNLEWSKEIYDVIKKHANIVDGSLDDCVVLLSKLKKLWDDPWQILDDIITAMIHTGQDQYYSIASPSKLAYNLGTIYNKIKANLQKKSERQLAVF